MKKVVRIANSSGYWGDDPEALHKQVTLGEVDYVTGDYLAEITMVILERQRRANPKRGYAYDFVGHLRRALPEIARRGIRVVANAGGVNPEACREAIAELCRGAGVSIPIAVVEGGDLMPRIAAMRENGVSFAHLDTRQEFSTIADTLVSAHAYLGARPIAAALDRGAQIVITTRVTDAAVALGPMIHEFGWSETDWNRLAAGTVAGHLLECGGQATGGNYTDFLEVPLWSEKNWFGYPIAEVEESGDFVITKHDGTAGLVNVKSITEQLLYEIGDPKAYLTPDVTCDFTSVKLEQVGRDRVRVSGAKGFPAPPYLKVSAVYTKGYRATGMVLLSGPRTRQKAEHLAQLLWSRLKHEFEDSRADLIGFDACWLGAAPEHTPNEGVLRFAVRDGDRSKVDEFSRLLLGLGLQGPPGLGMLGGRPEVQEAFAFWPTLVPRHLMEARVQVDGSQQTEPFTVPMRLDGAEEPKATARSVGGPTAKIRGRTHETRHARLVSIAYGRSGDKGDSANIGIAARSDEAYDFLRQALTAEVVAEYYKGLCQGEVIRYELPNIRAFNFVLKQALGGGGTLSLRVDHQGKTLAQGLLRMELDVPVRVFESVKLESMRDE